MQASLAPRDRLSKGIPKVVATKIRVPNACQRFLLGDTGALGTAKGEYGHDTHQPPSRRLFQLLDKLDV